MIGEFRTDLEPLVKRTEVAILRVVHEVVPTARLDRIGPIDINGPSWSCWIITDSDAERGQLANDKRLRAALDNATSNEGFPPDSFTFQSQETVDRDFEGSWFYAMR